MERNTIKEMLNNSEIKHAFDQPLSKLTTFQIGGVADILTKVDSIDTLKLAVEICRMTNIPFFVIGAGSNILASDHGYRGMVLKLTGDFNAVTVMNTKVTCGAAMGMIKLSIFAKENSLSGFEFACGIPGTLGGAIYMNASAFGTEILKLIHKVTVFDLERMAVEDVFPPFEYGYRKSPFQDRKKIILAAEIFLVPAVKQDIEQKMKEYTAERKKNQPWDKHSAGSVFRNPEGAQAYELIRSVKLAGTASGGARISEKHANFIVTEKGASASDVITLMRTMREKVKAEFNIDLKTEIEFMGEMK